MCARKEEKEATAAKKALQSELEEAQVNTEAVISVPHTGSPRSRGRGMCTDCHWSSPPG